LKREKENKKKIEKIKNDPNRFNKLTSTSLKNEEEMMLYLEVYLNIENIEYDDCIFESSSAVEGKNEELVSFSLSRDSKYLSGEVLMERIDDNTAWCVKQLIKLE
jgi:hypothetical protein